jgi:predicted Zn finger-like uncharacterized protein
VFTECPTCQTIFRVTGAILRAGHGQVECGQCHVIFDAIDRLIDDIPPGPAPEPSASLEPASTHPDTGSDGGGVDATNATVRWANDLPTGEFLLRDGELIPVSDRAVAEPAGDAQDILVEEPGVPEEITLEGDRIEISGVYRAPETWEDPAEEEAEPLLAATSADAAGVVAPRVERRRQPRPLPRVDEVETELAVPDAAPRRTGLWALLTFLLLVGLAAQVVHHYRQELVRHPAVGPRILNLYASLGQPLAPNWDVTGYEIQQWGVAADPAAAGTLRLRASIMNRAGFAQPYPLLKLTLDDRWGDQVGSREFEPAEYLGPGVPADRLLEPNQRVNADIGIVDPGEDAVGFHVDVCLRGSDGLDCASQAP